MAGRLMVTARSDNGGGDMRTPGWTTSMAASGLGGAAVAACALFGAVAAVPAVAAQEPDRDTTRYRVTLHLRDAATDGPLRGALIELPGRSGRYVTGVDGRVALRVPAGSYALVANKGGYATLHGGFLVERDGELRVAMRELGDVDAGVPGRLMVRISEFGTGRLMRGAVVSVPGAGERLSDGRGWAEFRNLSGPAARVTVEGGIGYETRTETVSLREGRTTFAEVAMAIDAVVLAPLEVEVESGFLEKQGVYWRIERGWPTKLLTRDELIERSGPRLADAFRNLPGVRVDYRGALAVLTTHMGCVIPVFLDGRRMEPSAAALNIDDIEAQDVELAEFYEPGRAPARFGGTDPRNCGAVALWSRSRAGKGGAMRMP